MQTHMDHSMMVRSVTFRDQSIHWELRCRDCDRFIKYVTEAEANQIYQLLDEGEQ